MEEPIDPGSVINRHQCFGCALKHLSSALVLAGEIRNGYDNADYHLYLLGNLAEAQEQLALRVPKLAERIRALRLAIFGDSGTAAMNADATAELLALSRIVKNVLDAEASPRDASAAPVLRKRCSCAKNRASAPKM